MPEMRREPAPYPAHTEGERAAPDLARSTGLCAGVTGANLTDPNPWRIPCLLAVRAIAEL